MRSHDHQVTLTAATDPSHVQAHHPNCMPALQISMMSYGVPSQEGNPQDRCTLRRMRARTQ
eukprot:25347-Eustigmatos_ZCMA.PRE.1